MAALRTACLHDRYLRREPVGDGFCYLRPDGRLYRDRAGLARIAALAVPPAYREVYVSPDPEAELQAFGRDARGRLQYCYHPDFVHRNAMHKWRRLARFAAALPRLREATAADLRRAGLPRRKVLGLMTRLLYRVYFRVGSACYTRSHRSYGLTTLCKRHVRVDGSRVTFCYRGKHGVVQEQVVRERSVAAIVERLLALPGKALFQYEEDGVRHPVRAAQLNAYIREVMGPFSSKDFRTWGGTLQAAEFLAAQGPPPDERAGARVLVRCVRAVAAGLGNSAAVTRASYISPLIFDLYLSGRVLDDYAPEGEDGLSRGETALRRMLSSRLGGRAVP
jgi:DNA topoisomerase I